MLQLHLSQLLLTTIGVVAFLAVPQPLVDNTRDTVITTLPFSSQPDAKPKNVVKKKPAPVQEKRIEKIPVIGSANRIVVPSIGIDIGVQTGSYDAETNSWQVDDSSAFYAGTTVPVNDTNGTTLIYGHARWGIFGTLPDVQPGAEVTVYTAEGIRFVYSFESLTQVDPSDTSMLTAQGEPRLILQTCSGFFDQYRTLARFTLKEVVRG